MRHWQAGVILGLCMAGSSALAQQAPNPLIDAERYLADSAAAMQAREGRLLDEAEFMAMAAQPGSLILDARSNWAFERLHIAGALNLAYTDFNAETLTTLIPSVETRILIYCNNNFLGAPGAFPTKLPATSLNLATLSALHSYGYRNVYQLGPVVDVAHTILPLSGADAAMLSVARTGSR